MEGSGKVSEAWKNVGAITLFVEDLLSGGIPGDDVGAAVRR